MMSTALSPGPLLDGEHNPLAKHYQDFQVHSRVLLTGHSHQAWPDCAQRGVLEAYQDACEHVDDKWGNALAKASRVQRGYASMLEDTTGEYVLGQNVHELGLRCLSSLSAYQDASSLRSRAPILTTHGEFHSMRRQLDRLAEFGIELDRVAHNQDVADSLIAKLEAQRPGHYGAVLLSSVGFLHGLWVPGLDRLAQAARTAQTPLIIDAYHSVNVCPLSVRELGLEDAFILGGGYKYCQLGEGVCFLRIPPNTNARPAITGWFAEFELRDRLELDAHVVRYSPGAAAFAGSTYDPTSHYRAAEVLDFFESQGLDVPTLRAISQAQITHLRKGFESLNLNRDKIRLSSQVPDEQRAGFLALTCPDAPQISAKLREHQVFTDARGETLRLGPAPYLSYAQLDAGLEALRSCLR